MKFRPIARTLVVTMLVWANARAASSPFLSPTALAATADGKTLFVACATAGRVLVFDTASRKAVKQIAVPDVPLGMALSPDELRLYVACAAPVSMIAVVDVAKQKAVQKIPAGHTATALVCSPDGKTLYVCNRFNDCVGVVDLARGAEVARIAVPREPVAVALTPDGKLLFVANHLHTGRSDVDVVAATVSVINTAERRVVKEIELPNGSGLLRGVAISPDGKFVAVTHTLARFHLPTTQIERGWINNNALTLINTETCERLNTVLLDNVDAGAGNPWAVAWTRDGNSICVTHAGTHELSVIDAPALLAKLAKVPVKAESPGYSATVSRTAADVPNDLAFMVGLKRRIKLEDEKGPRAVAVIGDKVFTANYFSDSLSVVDLATNHSGPVETIALGPKQKPSLARQGELHFNDASLCFQGWQSCASCHSSDARVDGLNWDNLNDGIGNPKNVKSLLLAHRTPPAMWLSVREDAVVAVRAGITNSLFAVLPEGYANALDEYLKSLKPIPSPHLAKGKLSVAALRGKKLFFSEDVGCAECHAPPLFTDLKSHNVGTRNSSDQPRDKFDTPSLIELWRTAPYLHDGSSATVRELIAKRNDDAHGKTSHLTSAQIADLVEFLLSL